MPTSKPNEAQQQYIVFQDGKRIAMGNLSETLAQLAKSDPGATMPLTFDALTGEQVELPASAATDLPARPGRPKLGVVPREVTLLPQDWEWLGTQPGGASVTLRKLVLRARRESAEADRIREAQSACYRFINAIAGNLANFEEVTRALFAGDRKLFEQHMHSWPADIQQQAGALASNAFAGPAQP